MLSGLNYRIRAVAFVAITIFVVIASAPPNQIARAQDDETDIDKMVEEDTAADDKKNDKKDSSDASTATTTDRPTLNLFDLIFRRGGSLVYVIAVLLVMVILFTIERGLAMRKIKVLPDSLVTQLGKLANDPGGFDPRKAYRVCQEHPSAASRIIRAMLLKVGRPHSEVERAVREASEREASDLYSNVRWLNLAATVAPLLGLLGTVWGMIQAFFDLGYIDPGADKAAVLAKGIYVALVTTFAGLSVAIPAATVAHYFEGRIQSLFRQIDELLFGLLPQVERYEGKIRVSRQHLSGDLSADGHDSSEVELVRDTPPAPPAGEPVGAKSAN